MDFDYISVSKSVATERFCVCGDAPGIIYASDQKQCQHKDDAFVYFVDTFVHVHGKKNLRTGVYKCLTKIKFPDQVNALIHQVPAGEHPLQGIKNDKKHKSIDYQ